MPDKRNYTYGGYVPTLSERLQAALTTIRADHNFDLGDEFEQILCRTLRDALPERYGICRGFLTAADGSTAGDDIIIYSQDRFPTLAIRDKQDYARKEYVPIEAAYAVRVL